jgi:hypothetical protein
VRFCDLPFIYLLYRNRKLTVTVWDRPILIKRLNIRQVQGATQDFCRDWDWQIYLGYVLYICNHPWQWQFLIRWPPLRRANPEEVLPEWGHLDTTKIVREKQSRCNFHTLVSCQHFWLLVTPTNMLTVSVVRQKKHTWQTSVSQCLRGL